MSAELFIQVRLLLKKFFRFLALFFVPFVGSIIIRFLYLSNKKEFYAPSDLGEDVFIMACWHGDLLMIPYAYTRYRKNPHVKLIISEHFDGNLIAKCLSFFGFGSIRGSSTRGGARVLIQSMKELKNGYDIGITPDGPKGPRHEVSDGIAVMAKKVGVNIVLVKINPTKYWQLKSWDRFVIPKPFGTIKYYISEPIDISDMQIQEAKDFIKERLLRYEH